MKVDAIATQGPEAIEAARKATSTIPIAMVRRSATRWNKDCWRSAGEPVAAMSRDCPCLRLSKEPSGLS